MKYAIDNCANRICALLLVAVALAATGAGREKADLARMRDQIRVLESVLNQSLSQNFPGPFAYLDAAHGAYLPGYGVVFTFEVNLAPTATTPFGSRPAQSDRARKDEGQKRREQAKAMAQKVIADFGHTLDQLAPGESLAIVIHGSTVGERGLERSTVVLRAQKRDIDDFRSNTLDRAAFLHKLEVLEY